MYDNLDSGVIWTVGRSARMLWDNRPSAECSGYSGGSN